MKNQGKSGVACAIAAVLFTLVGIVPLAAQSAMVELAKGSQSHVVELRHFFHEHPETRWAEENTLLSIERGLHFHMLAANAKHGEGTAKIVQKKGGLWLDYTVSPKFDRILFRADIDALPVTEATGLPYASKVPGKMHACGHDAHTAMLITAFTTMVDAIDLGALPIKHNIRFVFQRAEENPVTKNGGQTLVEDDHVLEGISAVYALHIWVGAPGKSGLLMSRPGALLANNDQFRVRVACKGGHVAMPEDGCNAIEVASDIEHAMRGIDRRILGPMAPASIVPAVFLAGTDGQANVRPASADMWFSCRTFLDMKGRSALSDELAAKAIAVARTYGAQAKVDFVFGYPATINDPASVARVSKLLQSAGLKYEETEPSLGGEDFSYYLQQRPGADFYLAAWQKGTGGHHSPTFNPDESVLWQGVAYWLTLATN